MLLEPVCLASTIMMRDLIMPFSIAISTVLPINRFSRSLPLRCSLRNLHSELGFIRSVFSGVMPRKVYKIVYSTQEIVLRN